MPLIVDQLNRTVELTSVPQKIISVVPSQTDLLFDLGLNEEVIGITKFCVHPQQWFRIKTRIGGTKTLHLEKIKGLQPDFIIANKEENVKEQIETLAKDFPVWISDVNNLQDAVQMMAAVGEITGRQNEAEMLITQIKTNFASLTNNQISKESLHLKPLQTQNPKLKTAYLIWKDPYMTVGGDTFINNMLNYAGFENIFAQLRRYPQITIEQLRAANCQLLLLSSEPYPFRQKHIDELQGQLPDTKIILADGEMFSWYGSRLLKAPAYFQELQIQALSLF
ncbi:MAG: ABC transporter substrate-binding protein [Flavisolibacter sp.]